MIVAALLSAGAIAVLANLVFHLSIFALAFAVGLCASSLAYGSGAGLFGAAATGIAAGALTQAAGKVAFEHARSPLVRLAIIGLFAAPAAVAGYAVVDRVVTWTVPGEGWRLLFAALGAIVTGAVACQRISTFAPPGSSPARHAERSDVRTPGPA